MADEGVEFAPGFFGGGEGFGFHLAVEGEGFFAGWGEFGALGFAAAVEFDEGIGEGAVHFLDEVPDSHVGHADLASGGGEGAGFVDGGEDVGFAGAENELAIDHDAMAEAAVVCVTRSGLSRSGE
jgi:hypothetical protein